MSTYKTRTHKKFNHPIEKPIPLTESTVPTKFCSFLMPEPLANALENLYKEVRREELCVCLASIPQPDGSPTPIRASQKALILHAIESLILDHNPSVFPNLPRWFTHPDEVHVPSPYNTI
jgi:hypothetical protein